MNVFETFNVISSNDKALTNNNFIHIDNTLSYAPTINYHLKILIK